MHDLALILITAGIVALVAFRMGQDSGRRDEYARISRHLLRIRRDQERMG